MTPQRAEILTKYLKRYDRRLSAKWAGDKMIHILFSDANVNSLVMSLTHDWSSSGQPVLWGIEVVLLRLRQINESENSNLAEIRKRREEAERSEKRAFKSNIENGLHEQRREFAKAFNDINTSTLDKKKDKRRLKGA